MNRFFAIRHGYSKANELGLIVSRFENGSRVEYGLSERGVCEAKRASATVASLVRSRGLVIASDFSRTIETAELIGLQVYLQPLLRERDFGDLELTSNANYGKVWALDESGAEGFNAESVEDVAGRVKLAVDIANRSFKDTDIFLVSHGDTLQIAQAWFRREDPRRHRSMAHLETGEVRELG